MKTEKILLIYKYKILNNNNYKLALDIMYEGKYSNKKGRNFERYTDEENIEFLKEWKKRNKINLKDYKVCLDFKKAKLENEIPVIVERRN